MSSVVWLYIVWLGALFAIEYLDLDTEAGAVDLQVLSLRALSSNQQKHIMGDREDESNKLLVIYQTLHELKLSNQ